MINKKINFDGPSGIRKYREKIRSNVPEDEKGLIFFNTLQRRFLLPFAHVIYEGVDIQLLHKGYFDRSRFGRKDLSKYEYIFVANFYVPYEKETYFSGDDVRIIKNV